MVHREKCVFLRVFYGLDEEANTFINILLKKTNNLNI